MSRKRILVTGASGFIGKATVKALMKSEQWDIYAVISGRREVDLQPGVNVVKADLLDLQQIDSVFREVKPDTVVHLAWQMTSKADRCKLTNLDWLKVSIQILQVFAENGGRRLVFAGSGSEYGGGCAVDGTITDCVEEISDAPADLYGICKYAFGKVAGRIAADLGFEYVHPRIFSVYGPGELNLHGATAAAAAAFLSSQPFVCKAPNNIWDYVYVDDVADMLAELAAGTFTGIVNISGTQIRMGDLFRLIAEAAGNPDLLTIENTAEAGTVLVGSKDRMNKVFANLYPTPVEQGVNATVEWRRKNLEETV